MLHTAANLDSPAFHNAIRNTSSPSQVPTSNYVAIGNRKRHLIKQVQGKDSSRYCKWRHAGERKRAVVEVKHPNNAACVSCSSRRAKITATHKIRDDVAYLNTKSPRRVFEMMKALKCDPTRQIHNRKSKKLPSDMKPLICVKNLVNVSAPQSVTKEVWSSLTDGGSEDSHRESSLSPNSSQSKERAVKKVKLKSFSIDLIRARFLSSDEDRSETVSHEEGSYDPLGSDPSSLPTSEDDTNSLLSWVSVSSSDRSSLIIID